MNQLVDMSNTPRSRSRLKMDSSPSFGDFSPIGIEDLEALNRAEAALTQAPAISPLARKRKRSPSPASPRHLKLPSRPVNLSNVLALTPTEKVPAPKVDIKKPSEESAASDDFDNEFDDLDVHDLPVEDNYASWFQPATGDVPTFVSFTRPSAGPLGGKPKVIQPSAAALQAARKLIESVEAQVDDEAASVSAPKPPNSGVSKPAVASIAKLNKPRASMNAGMHKEIPATPRPLPTSKPLPVQSQPVEQSKDEQPQQATPQSTILAPFNITGSPQSAPNFIEPKRVVVTAPSTSVTPQRTVGARSALESPISVAPKHLGMRNRPRGSLRSKFATPWKQGVVAEPSKAMTPKPALNATDSKSSTSKVLEKEQYRPPIRRRVVLLPHSVFDLNPPEKRQSLCELAPVKKRSVKDAEEQGIHSAVGDIEPWNALYWAFEEDGERKGVEAASEALKKAGCTLLEREWLQNHWSLIIWKLANTVLMWPATQAERWSFREVLNQLLYRYEREINRCQRPAIRLIQERDASPNAVMILCVYEIAWPNHDHGDALPTELVLTDGWYKIRAQIDVAIGRAVKRQRIRIGTKLEVIGAKLDAHRKDADDVLKSFNSSSIIITGNGTHLAPWHSKLGFKGRPSIPTLNSLTHDGGVVPLMFVTVKEALPLAFIEMEPGKERITRDENEERAERTRWMKQRSDEESRLKEDACKQMERIQATIDYLENMAGSSMSRARASQGSPPEAIDSVLDDIEDSDNPKSVVKSLSPLDAAWAALALQERLSKKQESLSAEIEAELTSSFPARNVRSMRVLQIQDAVASPKRGVRKAQVTLWNAEEMEPNAIVRGKTYMVTNLVPTLPKGWTKSEAYLFTRRDTQWRKVTLPSS